MNFLQIDTDTWKGLYLRSHSSWLLNCILNPGFSWFWVRRFLHYITASPFWVSSLKWQGQNTVPFSWKDSMSAGSRPSPIIPGVSQAPELVCMPCSSDASLPLEKGLPAGGWRELLACPGPSRGGRGWVGVLSGQASGWVPAEPGENCPRGLAGSPRTCCLSL